MERDATKIVVSLFTLAIFVGVVGMIIRNPNASNTLLGASASSFTGVVNALEGKPVTG